jgi:integrase
MRFTYKGKQIRRSLETEDKKLAERISHKILGQVAEGKWFGISKESEKTFRELMDKYMNEHSKLKKKSWRRDEVSLSHLLPFFGDHTLAEIPAELISQYKNRRLQEKAKPATLNRELSLMKHSFNLALKEWDWVKENPCCRVKMERENNERERVLGYDEEERLLEVCPSWLREIVIFALDTGAREGEILGLDDKMVDLFRKIVTILQSKTGQYKTIPLTTRVLEILKANLKVRHLHCNLIFSSENGTRITASNLGRAFRKALKSAGIEDFRFHDLRHTFASRCAQGGVDLYLIQKYLGHKDPRMVQRYSHHSIGSLRGGIEVLEKQRLQFMEEKLAQI